MPTGVLGTDGDNVGGHNYVRMYALLAFSG